MVRGKVPGDEPAKTANTSKVNKTRNTVHYGHLAQQGKLACGSKLTDYI